ncbi:MAG TPA: asparagine synthase-related protein [Thermoanaerobaculia bacterium]|nr:asparagine synthase-related protein [Thermoanaerobaculia bacterium]
MMAAGFVVSSGADGVRIRTYSERLISTGRRGPFTAILLGRIYYRPPGQYESDAALVAALYERGGLGALERLEGDFVLVAHDGHAQKVVAVRSPMGAYPLFWTQGETFAIATSLRPLVEQLQDVRIDDEYVADYLAYPLASMMELPAERTAYRDVQRLLPGWSLELNLATRHVQRRRSWDWAAHIESPRPATIEEAGEMIRERLHAAVRERLGRVGRTACHFSGGMDSTSVALLAEPLLAARGESLEALTHVYSRDPILATEREYIECALEGRRALRHHVLLSDDILRWDAIDDVPPLDEPSTGIAFYRQSTALADLARDAGADTILGGDGADHLFAHSPAILAAELLRGGHVLRALHLMREHAAATTGSAWLHLRETIAYVASPTRLRVPPWFTRDYAAQQRLAERTASRAIGYLRGRRFGIEDLEELSGDWFNWHIGATRGILITQPFFDTRVMSLALGMPLRFHEPPHPMKPLLAAAMNGVLPGKIMHRSRKAHFGALVEGYARNRMALERLVELAPQEIFERAVLRDAIDRAALGIYDDAVALGRLDLTLAFLKWRSQPPIR